MERIPEPTGSEIKKNTYVKDFYTKYDNEIRSFVELSSKDFSSILSLIFSHDICNDIVLHIHDESMKIKHQLLEEYCKKVYHISKLIISGSGGEQWMPYGDSDIDNMFVELGLVKETQTSDSLYFQYTQYPSYVLLYRNHQLIKHSDVLKHEKYNKNFPALRLYEHGPAWCLRTPYWPNDDRSLVDQMETDIVPCFQLKQWPNITEEYFYRQRDYAWPPNELLEKCLNNKIFCLLTPVGYKLSSQCEYEWRISFSMFEIELVKTLTKNQRLCYILFKSICKEYVLKKITSPSLFGSYILKNIFFYWCETTPSPSSSNILDSIKQLFKQLYNCLLNNFCPHYVIKTNNLLSTIDSKDLIEIRQIIENDDRMLKNIIIHQPMFVMFYECFFQQCAKLLQRKQFSTIEKTLFEFYMKNIDRETSLVPIIYTYDSIFTTLANVFNPMDSLEFEHVLMMLNDLYKKYEQEEKNEKGKGYINFTNIIQRCIGNLHLQNGFFINTMCEDNTGQEINEMIKLLNRKALEEVRKQYANSHPLFNIDKTDKNLYNDHFSGAAMIAYLNYFNKFNSEEINLQIAKSVLDILVESQDAIFSNFNRAKLAVQIPVSTYFCDNYILKFLAQQSTDPKNPPDKTFDARTCSVIFISPLPLLIYMYVMLMIKLDFRYDELINYDFTMDNCLIVLNECYEYDHLAITRFISEEAKKAWDSYVVLRQLDGFKDWDPYASDTDQENISQ